MTSKYTEDDTFDRLRRPSYSEVEEHLIKNAGSQLIYKINTDTFEASIWPRFERYVAEMGWTMAEFNDSLNCRYRQKI